MVYIFEEKEEVKLGFIYRIQKAIVRLMPKQIVLLCAIRLSIAVSRDLAHRDTMFFMQACRLWYEQEMKKDKKLAKKPLIE